MKLAERYFELMSGSKYHDLSQQLEAETDTSTRGKMRTALMAERVKSLLTTGTTYTVALALAKVLDVLFNKGEEEK